MGSSTASPASADFSTYSPGSQGLRPSSRVFTRGCLPRCALAGLARRASPGVPCPSAHAGRAGPLIAGLPTPATFRPQGFDPLAGLLPARPPGPVSCRSAPGLRPSGACSSRVRRHLSRGPSPPRRWLPAGCALHGGLNRASSVARSASPSSRLPVPGVRTHQPAFRPTPLGSLPSWASSSLRLSRCPPRRHRSGGDPPHGLPSDLRACAPRSPRPSGVCRRTAWLDSWSRAASPRFLPQL
jgi:hypothetical protein